jgi:ABC-type Fe3+ transport system substrate-binding protein
MNATTGRRPVSRALAGLAVAALVLSACGSDEADTSAPAGGSDGGASAEAEAPAADTGMVDGVVVRMDGEDGDAYLARLYEAALGESGSVLYYTSAGDEENEVIKATFETKYPGIELNPVAASSGTILERALVESETGRVQGDVYGGSANDQAILDGIGALQKYDAANGEDLDANFQLPGPYFALGYLSYHVAYNTDRVDASEIPSDWMGFCDERWRGNLAIDSEAGEWVTGLIAGMGEAAALEFLECIAGLEPRLVRGSTNRTELLAAGEFDVALDLYGHRIARFEREGAPIKGVVPQPNPMPVVMDMVGLLGNGPNPNSGRLLVEFFLTADGQQFMIEQLKPGSLGEAAQAHPYPELIEGATFAVMDPTNADFDRGNEVFLSLFLN